MDDRTEEFVRDQSHERSLMESLQKIWDDVGSDLLPRTVRMHPDDRDQLSREFFDSLNGCPMTSIDRLETDFGTIRIQVDPMIPYGTFVLVQ